MGADRGVLYEGSCSCGKGRYEVYTCEPDYRWVRTGLQWYESKIHCPSCSDKFVLEVRNHEICAIPKSELAKRKQRGEKYLLERKEIMEYAATKGYLTSLKKLMDIQTSAGAIYRVLKGHIQISDSEQAFRSILKSLGTTQRWIEVNIFPDHLPGVLALLGQKDSYLMDLLRQYKRMRHLYQQPVEAAVLRTGFKRKISHHELVVEFRI